MFAEMHREKDEPDRLIEISVAGVKQCSALWIK